MSARGRIGSTLWRAVVIASLVGVASAASTSASCNIYTESLLIDSDGGLAGSSGSGGDGSAGSGGACERGECWWSKENEHGCRTAGLPGEGDRPSGTEAGDVGPIYLALDQIWLGQRGPEGVPAGQDVWQHVGLDLDGVCTNSASCTAAPLDEVGCKSGLVTPFDGRFCRDNVFMNLQPIAATVSDLGPIFGLTQDSFDCSIARGSFNILFKISEYNGKADDEQVRVDFYMSPGLVNQRDWDCTDPERYKGEAPWLPTEQWTVHDIDLQGQQPGAGGELPPSRLSAPNGYVRDGYLVTLIPDGGLVRFIGDNSIYPGFPLRVRQGLFLGKLSRGMDSLWRLGDGLMAGRIRREDMLQSFQNIGFCENVAGSDWTLLNNYLNDNMDVLSDGANDPSRDCDAMSMAIAFTAVQSTPGPPVAASELTICPPPPGGVGGSGGGSGAGGTGGVAGTGGAAGAGTGGMAGGN